ncbi:hypothetical protein J7I98_30120 [Streptomyces sp. ISL-98]|nr:hypothetical protein [Streptomyces sp. ISL-98]MBT2510039.1 hypothetical protein [Streptomyces sp. ISL-98]
MPSSTASNGSAEVRQSSVELVAAGLRSGRAGGISDAAVDHLRALPPEEREHDVLDEDVARVSPLKHANLNCLGRYSFAARSPRGGLRPLRDPATVHLDGDDEGTGE